MLTISMTFDFGSEGQGQGHMELKWFSYHKINVLYIPPTIIIHVLNKLCTQDLA